MNPPPAPIRSPAGASLPDASPTIASLTIASLTIATRESRLALWQAEHVQALLSRGGRTVKLLGMTTLGDQILDRSLSKVGGKGLFVKELETALEDGRADLAVHSLKDVPMDLPEGFSLACVMAREDPRDAFVSNRYLTLADLPQGAVVGTSSLRRTVLLKALRPDLKIEPLRGNLDTRLRKLDDGHYAAIVLAAAGLKRLGLANRIASVFETDVMLPAAGQGALGIEIRSTRHDLVAALAPLADHATWLAVAAERAVSRAMGGSCSMPLAAHAVWKRVGDPATQAGAGQLAILTSGTDVLEIHAAWGEPDIDVDADTNSGAGGGGDDGGGGGAGAAVSRPLVRAHLARAVADLDQAAALGQEVARLLMAGGARSLRPAD